MDHGQAYCKNCHNSLEITRNTRREDGNVKSVSKPEDLVKLKVSEGEQYIVNFNEGTLRYYILENKIGKEDEKELYKKFKSLIKQQKNVAQFIFLCNSCNTSYVIQPGTVFYNISFDTKNRTEDDEDVNVKIFDPIQPRTKDYVCPKRECDSHKDTSNKEALFYKTGHGYHTKYICCMCKTTWNVWLIYIYYIN